MHEWQNFYFLCGSAAASLIGLMFLAITFGSRLIKRDDTTNERVGVFMTPIAAHFMHVFFLSAVALVPCENIRLLGVCGLISTGLRAFRMPRAFRVLRQTAKDTEDIETFDWVFLLWLPTLGYAVLLAGSIALICDWPAAEYAFAAAIVLLMLIGMKTAWETLIWIAQWVNDETKKT
jgi:hypothetical protein